MDKYWMVYRSSKRRELGEDFSSREPQTEPVAEPTAASPSRIRLFWAAVRRSVGRFRAAGQKKRLSEVARQ